MPRTVHLLSLTGKTKAFEIDDDQFLPDNDVLVKEGFSDGKFIVCPSKPEDFPAVSMTCPKRIVVSSVDELSPDMQAPPVPQPADKDSVLPNISEVLDVSTTRYFQDGTSDYPFFVYVDGFNTYMPAFERNENLMWCDPSFPRPHAVKHLRYWQNMWSVGITGPQEYQREVTTTLGMEHTKTETLSAEMGVEFKNLSAKMSKSVETSVTINVAVTTTDTYSFFVPENKVGKWTLWQLVDQFMLVDEHFEPLSWSGHMLSGVSKSSASFEQHTFDNNLNIYEADLVLFDK